MRLSPDFRGWLQAAVTLAKIDFRSTLNSRRAENDVGFPLIYFRFHQLQTLSATSIDSRV